MLQIYQLAVLISVSHLYLGSLNTVQTSFSNNETGAESPHEPLDQPAPTQNDESIIIDIPVQEGTSGAGQFGMVFIFISFPAFLLGFLI